MKKIIPSYPEYVVYDDGRVFSIRSNKFLKPALCGPVNKRYMKVALTMGKQMKVHRLVAMAFIPNPENKPQVNHIDGNKLNNHLSNLEWVTQSENMLHAYKLGLSKPRVSSGKENPMYGKKHTEETKKKISEKATGRKHTEETKKKLSEAGKNRKLSEEHKIKIGEALKNRIKEKNPMYGKKHTEESKRKMSEARKKYYELKS